MDNRIIDLGSKVVRIKKDIPADGYYTLQLIDTSGGIPVSIVGIKKIQKLKDFLEEFLDDLQLIELNERKVDDEYHDDL